MELLTDEELEIERAPLTVLRTFKVEAGKTTDLGEVKCALPPEARMLQRRYRMWEGIGFDGY